MEESDRERMSNLVVAVCIEEAQFDILLEPPYRATSVD
jgi:hypothetical protein